LRSTPVLLVALCSVLAATAESQPPSSASGTPLDTAVIARLIEALRVVPPPGDSIVVTTTQIDLRTGEEYNLWRLIPMWRDSTGAVYRMGGVVFRTEKTAVYETTARFVGVRARQPGVAYVYLEQPTHDRYGNLYARRASTRIAVIVRP
jgi:hypothetical protein